MSYLPKKSAAVRFIQSVTPPGAGVLNSHCIWTLLPRGLGQRASMLLTPIVLALPPSSPFIPSLSACGPSHCLHEVLPSLISPACSRTRGFWSPVVVVILHGTWYVFLSAPEGSLAQLLLPSLQDCELPGAGSAPILLCVPTT